MKITRIDTLTLAEFPTLLFVQIHTDAGLIGLGETLYGPDEVAAFIHSQAAPYLLGKDPLEIERHWTEIFRIGRSLLTRCAEIRALSALDIALWDIFGQATGLPIYQLLGGKVRDRIQVYNTCAGFRYGPSATRKLEYGQVQASDEGRYEDFDAFMHRADELAHSLYDEGYRAMKIWPFDQFVAKTNGQYISLEDLEIGLEPFRKIRRALGDKMEIMVEMHSLWNLPSAIRIAKALEDLRPMWYEDPLRMDNLDALSQFKAATPIPTCASETVATRWAYRDMLERHAVSIVMLDIAWVGGISEARKIANLAEAHHLPFAPHDCTGPVTLMASVHLCMHGPNALIQETVRAFNHGWYPRLVTALPHIEAGYVHAPTGPGLGLALLPEVFTRSDLHLRSSTR
jgi:L-alanine-DL-glutamate epimerase-like enolase superfamily enzyme